MRTYEVVFIVGANTPEDVLQKLVSQLETVITDQGGTISKVDYTTLGRRKLAYPINKLDEGIYTIIHFEGSGHEVAELERRMRVNDLVLRYLVVRTDEDLKRAEKMKSRRKAVAASGSGNGDGAGGNDLDQDRDDDDEFDS